MTDDLLHYLSEAVGPYHAVAEAVRRLKQQGYTRLKESDKWQLEAGHGYYVIRDGASLIAFNLPEKSHEPYFAIFGAHTDSPHLRIKTEPVNKNENYRRLGVEIYGGALLHTWFDRDLDIGGQIYTEISEEPLLVRFKRPVARVPSLAIHLDRKVNSEGPATNPEKHLLPVTGLSESDFIDELAGLAGCRKEEIISHDLYLFDHQGPSLGGLNNEFIFSGRLDNLAMCHAGLAALQRSDSAAENRINLVALFDHEEIGSETESGAMSPFLTAVAERILANTGHESRESYRRSIASSFLISADMAHGVHPAYPDKHDKTHRPLLNSGVVFKKNVSWRYAGSTFAEKKVRELARAAEVPVQIYHNRADLACGSTIGPLIAARTGITSIDLGNPMLSMHSIREMAGSEDHEHMVRLITRFFTAG